MIRPDLDDSTQMYAHYTGNKGTPIEFDYEEAYKEDAGIRAAVDVEIRKAQQGADQFAQAGHTNFQMTGEARATTLAEYPKTENWQKTIGGYQVWSSANVTVNGNVVTMTVTVHAEDHYNFNPGQTDIASGAPDDANGRFTEIGWAKPFDSHGQITRTVTWTLSDPPPNSTAGSGDPQFNPGREDRSDGIGSEGGRLENNRDTGSVRG